MDTTQIGRLAEQHAANYLIKNHGYQLLASNWRTRTCEIDLVMQSERSLYFIEVKFRKNNFNGGGIASISPQKIARMYSAVSEWQTTHPQYSNLNPNLSAIEVTGKNLEITNYIESIDVDIE